MAQNLIACVRWAVLKSHLHLATAATAATAPAESHSAHVCGQPVQCIGQHMPMCAKRASHRLAIVDGAAHGAKKRAGRQDLHGRHLRALPPVRPWHASLQVAKP